MAGDLADQAVSGVADGPRASAKSLGDAEEGQWAAAVAGVVSDAGGDGGDSGGA